MQIYLAGRYTQKESLKHRREQLQTRGHEVTSRWLELPADEELTQPYTEMERIGHALNDCTDIDTCQLLIATFEPGVTGYKGTYFEVGAAMGLGIPVVWIGEDSCVFRHLPTIAKYRDWGHFLESVDPTTLRPIA